MLSWFRSKNASDEKIFDVALHISLEWGKNWGQPIQERIRKRFPQLDQEQADQLDAKCREIQKYCWDDLCYKELDGEITQDEVRDLLTNRYPEVSKRNASRLISQGMYYARK